MIKLYKETLVLAGVVLVSGLSIYSASGPALAFGLGRTNAPFDGAYCSSCHSGGSFSPTMSITLLQGSPATVPNVSVTSYVPGSAYTVRIARTAVSVPTSGGFGFQITCATLPSSNTNVNTWGALPTNTHITTLGSGASQHSYVEHSVKLSASLASIDIPWTGPASGTGTVKFYAAVNTVNGTGGTSGDQAIVNSLQVSLNPLPLTWLYFRGKEEKGHVLLEWATGNEANSNVFTIEKSTDGQNFSLLTTMNASTASSGDKTYSYIDGRALSNAYYRIKQTDINGNSTYYKTIQVKTDKMMAASHSIEGNAIVLQLESEAQKDVLVNLYAIDGKTVSSRNITLMPGYNRIDLEKPGRSGIYILKAAQLYTGTVVIP